MLGTIIVAVLVFALLGMALRYVLKSKKTGKAGGCAGCNGCGSAGCGTP